VLPLRLGSKVEQIHDPSIKFHESIYDLISFLGLGEAQVRRSGVLSYVSARPSRVAVSKFTALPPPSGSLKASRAVPPTTPKLSSTELWQLSGRVAKIEAAELFLSLLRMQRAQVKYAEKRLVEWARCVRECGVHLAVRMKMSSILQDHSRACHWWIWLSTEPASDFKVLLMHDEYAWLLVRSGTEVYDFSCSDWRRSTKTSSRGPRLCAACMCNI